MRPALSYGDMQSFVAFPVTQPLLLANGGRPPGPPMPGSASAEVNDMRVAKCRPHTAALLTANYNTHSNSVRISCAIVLAVVLYISGKTCYFTRFNTVSFYFQFLYYLLRCCTRMLGLTGPPNIFLVAPPCTPDTTIEIGSIRVRPWNDAGYLPRSATPTIFHPNFEHVYSPEGRGRQTDKQTMTTQSNNTKRNYYKNE